MIRRSDPKWVAITKWAALSGSWDFRDSSPKYETPTEEPAPPGAYGLAVCDEMFRDGDIRTLVQFCPKKATGNEYAIEKDESAGIVLGLQRETGGYQVAGLGAFDQAYAISEFVPGRGWINRKATGLIANLHYGKSYQLVVSQKGQRISLVVDGVPVLEHLLSSPPPGNQLGLFSMSHSPVQFEHFAVERRPPNAFVAMQFGEPYDTIYRTVIKPKAERLGFEVTRIDEVNRPGIIFQDIQRKIEDAKVVIAEITAPNQNVYYEVGYASRSQQADHPSRATRQGPAVQYRSYRPFFMMIR